MLTYRQISQDIVLLTNCPVKVQVSQAQSNWFVFQDAPAYQRQGGAAMLIPDMTRVK